MEQVLKALETSRKAAHKRIDELCDFECDLIDQKCAELLELSFCASNAQILLKDKFESYWPIVKAILNKHQNVIINSRSGKTWLYEQINVIEKYRSEIKIQNEPFNPFTFIDSDLLSSP